MNVRWQGNPCNAHDQHAVALLQPPKSQYVPFQTQETITMLVSRYLGVPWQACTGRHRNRILHAHRASCAPLTPWSRPLPFFHLLLACCLGSLHSYGDSDMHHPSLTGGTLVLCGSTVRGRGRSSRTPCAMNPNGGKTLQLAPCQLQQPAAPARVSLAACI